MIERTIETSLRQRMLVLIAVLAVIGLGIYHYGKLPIDAFPDISPIMVPIFAEAHGMAPEEVERLITFPIESAMNGLPGVTQVKSTSAFGLAVIYVYFEDDIDIYFARQIVSERLSGAMADLPALHEPPMLGPISTGLGQIFIYYLTLDEGSDTQGKAPLTYLREINDWVVKFQLQTVPGVTDILSIGGHVLQYQVSINPYALNKFGITIGEVVDAIRQNNRNVGGQYMVLGSEEHLVRGLGLLECLEHIGNIQIRTIDGVPIRIQDIAEVTYGEEIRRGVVTRNGEKEVVSGIVLKLFGENTSEVIEKLYEKIPEVQNSLPEGVNLIPYYEQAELVEKATDTVKKALLIGAVLVLLTLLMFLGNVRAAAIVAISLPLCALIAIICMGYSGLSANLMSLGGIAIAIGMLCDGSIVMVENIYRHLSDPGNKNRERFAVIMDAAHEVGRPIVFAIAIIIIVFLPLFTLQGVEGKLFSPMAFTISFALLGSMITATIVAPALSMYFLKTRKGREFALLHWLKKAYHPLLKFAVRKRLLIIGIAIVAFLISLLLLSSLGTEFVPTLEEGSIFISIGMAPSISVVKATETIMKLERAIINYPEVEETVSRIGRPEAGSHPHPVNYAEIHIELKPMSEWKTGRTKADLVEALDAELSHYPGVQLNFTQPIQNAFDELLSGIKAQLAIKLFGEDMEILRQKVGQIHSAIRDIPGLVDLSLEQSFGQPQVQIIADRDACSRYGVNVSELLEIVELAIGGEVIDQLYLGTRRFGIHVRYQEEHRANPEAIKSLLVHTESGASIPLAQVAEVNSVIGPIQINREKNQRRWVLSANVRGRDMGGVVSDIKERIEQNVELPPGYYVEYGGQFENQRRAMSRLGIIVPLTILLILLMLYLTFGKFRTAILIVVNVPLALIGGIFGLFIMGEYLSVPATVGFIALFGIAVQNGVVLVSYINHIRDEGFTTEKAIIQGALLRLRPVLMTALTTVLGLIPLLLSKGIGANVQRPLATVIVFGLTSSTFMTLFIIPALYKWFAPATNDR
jgi:cobalt-zinc-cadmium resistance protein CzcA